MTTIRRRLTFWYTVALGLTIVAFGTLLYLERRQSSLRELDQRLLLEADLADRWLSESYNVLDSLRLPKQSGNIDLGPARGTQRYLAVRVERAGPEVGGVLVATSLGEVAFGPSALLQSMLLIAPIVLAGAAVVGYWLAGTSLRPVEGIMDEVEAISDGRSLHRRP